MRPSETIFLWTGRHWTKKRLQGIETYSQRPLPGSGACRSGSLFLIHCIKKPKLDFRRQFGRLAGKINGV